MGGRILSEQDEPVLPIFVWESGDLSIYGSRTLVETALEADDVLDGIYEAYDATGARLELEVVPANRRYWFLRIPTRRVVVRRSREAPTDALRQILLSYLGPNDELAALPLAELQSLALQRVPRR